MTHEDAMGLLIVLSGVIFVIGLWGSSIRNELRRIAAALEHKEP